MFIRTQHVHFIGIGGIGMSGIAEILLNLGHRVSGSDLKRSPITDRLLSLGATIFEGHAASNISGADVVVTTSALSSKILKSWRRTRNRSLSFSARRCWRS